MRLGAGEGRTPMEAERFDRLVGAVSTRVSRRRSVAALLAGLLVAALPSRDLVAKRLRHPHDQGKTPARPRPAAPPPAGQDRLTGQIAGGTPVPPGTYPFAAFIRVALDDGDGFFCSGSLISPSHVLTAAHCTFDDVARASVPVSAFTVVVGQVNRL